MNHLRSLKIAFFLIVLIIIFPILVIAGQYKVTEVTDGDTIKVDYQGKDESIRLFCVDTQELNSTMGDAASNYAKEKFTVGEYINLEFAGIVRRGHYDRILAYVFINGQNFNLDLVKQGLSRYCTKYGQSQKYDSEFRGAEKSARKQKLNIWSDSEFENTYSW